ncbi:MAG: 5-formyltetrahydrofolate cyclo-ligase [Solidesulfovibrio sp. DCME]|uniref:5-formyltetrahydrofolate cyclo-ligase n=1 Tax=Solidesulfovibrio sp. DCME TaxID=3447380 RepID=UPI003D0BACDF
MQPYSEIEVPKAAMRREMRARRSALAPEFVQSASETVTKRLFALPRLAAATEILAYLPIRNEVDAGHAARLALSLGKRLLLPRCRPGAPGVMDLGCVACLDDLAPGSYGILEPRPDACRPAEAFSPGAILVPGLAFDPSGARLGYGGGYYDRLLSQPAAAGAFVVGLAYDFQIVPRLPREAWDKPVDAVVTERQTLLIPA